MLQLHKNKYFMSIMNLVVFFIVLFVNYWNVYGNPNAISEVSDKYLTFVTPTHITFSIWGIIYLFWFIISILLFFAPQHIFMNIYQLIFLQFILSILNPAWILLWINQQIVLSWICMLFLLITLSYSISKFVHFSTEITLINTMKSYFYIYFSWIVVAFSVNTAVLFSATGLLEPFGIISFSVAVFFVIIFFYLAYKLLFHYHIVEFIIVILWALLGILKQNQINQMYYIRFQQFITVITAILAIQLLFYIYKHLQKK